jgi:hypothetical protein
MRISSSSTLPCIAAFLAMLSPSWAFQPNVRLHTASTTQYYSSSSSSALRYSNWDAFETRDAMELMIGGARYEMVELPDSMMSTTLWVGNLCEFVTDDMLSEVFQMASSLKFVPACVARKPNMESMRYGFVTFRSEEEKDVSSLFCMMIRICAFVHSIISSVIFAHFSYWNIICSWQWIYYTDTNSKESVSR